MEPHKPNEPPPLAPTNEEILWTPTPGVVAVEKSVQPDATRLPVIVIAVVVGAAVVGSMATLAFVSTRAVAPVETARPAAVTPAPPAIVAESVPPPTWTGARRATWAYDGSKTIAFQLAATRDVSAWMNRARPALVVRCLSRKTEVFVILDTSASFEKDADRRTVMIQWDDESPSVQGWGVSEGGRELFAPESAAFVHRMVSARRMRFGFTPFNAEPVTAEFAVQGFDQLAGLVTNTCK